MDIIQYGAAAAFGYEAAAIASRGRLPTITSLCRDRHWLTAAVTGALAVHLLTSRGPLADSVSASGPS